MTCFNGCIEQESKRVFNIRQRKAQKVVRYVVSLKVLCSLNRGKCVPDLQHINGPKVEFGLVFINSKVTCKEGIGTRPFFSAR